ncbi:DUF935 family protein [Cryobacterium sp. TMT1-21]|uniref:phage portal protein family protein n=1 Tax=Cryobacterium sp. TMT1-21 TaxID=1259234 RepID=UPI00106B7E2D|nr:DUF935 family protein [Cryobacterium sp. TMT1-21]TFD09813.1 DUF935 family protein [Cryobacterium sp. TMT1-21]
MPEEQGYQVSGLSSWASMAAESHETNPDLAWPLSVEVFDKMRREDSQIGSVLRAVTLPIRGAEWMIDPAGASDEVVDLVSTDLGLPVKGRPPVNPLRTKGRFQWGEHLRLALLELVYGHSYFEQVYRPEGERLRLKKLAWRPPRSISKVNVARDGGLISIEQHGVKDPITVDRLVAYVNDREGGNWIGQSLLRTAYKNWLLKDRMLRAQALTVERNGLGVPVYTAAPVPDGASAEERDAWLKSEKEAGLKLAKGFRAGEAAGASTPNGSSLTLMGVTGKLPDTDAPIRYHDEQIARAVLAHFLNLGTETGSWALGSTFADFFTSSLNAVAAHVKDTFNAHVIEDLVDWNWDETEPAPRLVFKPIGSGGSLTAEALKSLIDAGVIKADESLETFMRAAFSLPVKDTAAPATESDGSISDADAARFAAEVVQKVYLGTNETLLSGVEARDLVRRAGANLGATGPSSN